MSKFSKIKLALQKLIEQFNSVVTDKGTLVYDDELIEGVSVRLVDEEGNESVPEDGDYYLGDDDGRTLVIESGVVKEIKENETESNDEPEEKETENIELSSAKQEFNRRKQFFEESYGDKMLKISDAFRNIIADSYVMDAGDDFAIVDVWDDEKMEYHTYHYSISWNEDEVVIGDSYEVKLAYVPVDESLNVELSKIKELESEIEQLNSKIEEFESKPQEDRASLKFKKQNSKRDEQFENLSRFI